MRDLILFYIEQTHLLSTLPSKICKTTFLFSKQTPNQKILDIQIQFIKLEFKFTKPCFSTKQTGDFWASD